MQITVFGEGNGNLLQYFCLGNPMDRKAWQAIAYGLQRAGHNLVTNTHTFTHMTPRKLLLSCQVVYDSLQPPGR